MGTELTVVVGLLLAAVAFRRGRRVTTPEVRRAAARQAIGSPSHRLVTAVLTVVRAAVGVAALVGVVWLARQLFA